jgi:hypothetical protein
VIGGIAAGWTACALAVSNLPPQRDGTAIRVGAGVILIGVLVSAWAVTHAGLLMTAGALLVLGCGFGLSWAFIARHAIASAPAEEQALASAAVPTTQLIGGAAGAAAAGAMANLLGFGQGIDPAAAQTHGFWLFAAFAPLAGVGFLAAWKLARV